MTHAELLAEIAAALHRTDLTSEIITFVTKAEQRIGRDVRIVENRIQSTETPSGGAVTLPTRFAEMIRISTGSGSTMNVLQAVSSSEAERFGTGGTAVAYYIQDKIYLLPDDATADVDICYYEYPEPLAGAAGSATRPIMTRYEALYLNASMMEGSLFMQDFEAYGIWAQRYTAEVTQANKAAKRSTRERPRSYYRLRNRLVGAV